MTKYYNFPIAHDQWPEKAYDDPFVLMKFNKKNVPIPKGMVYFFIIRDYKNEDMGRLRSIYIAREIESLLEGKIKKPKKKVEYVAMLECWDKIFKNQNYAKDFR